MKKKACSHCGSEAIVKNGSTRGRPKIKCKICGFQTVIITGKEHKPPHFSPAPEWKRLLSIILYNVGLSLNATANVVQVGTTTVLRWVKSYAQSQAKPEPGSVAVIEIDEMWHYLKKSPTNSGSGRLIVVIESNLLTGNAGIVMRLRSND
jgi:transposase